MLEIRRTRPGDLVVVMVDKPPKVWAALSDRARRPGKRVTRTARLPGADGNADLFLPPVSLDATAIGTSA